MKRWFILLFILVACVAVVAYETNASNTSFFMPDPLGGVKIVIDPGHGGMDGGASKGEVIEKDVTLAISKKVEKKLKKKGAEVIMTRTKAGDAIAEHSPKEEFATTRERKRADLFLRADIVEKEQPDIFVSIHANAIPETRWRGAQVFYHPDGHEGGELLAKSIQASIKERLKNTDREALAIKQVYLLKKAPMPSVLVETGFLSNPEEQQLLTSEKYQEKMANSIVEGIELYFESEVDESQE